MPAGRVPRSNGITSRYLWREGSAPAFGDSLHSCPRTLCAVDCLIAHYGGGARSLITAAFSLPKNEPSRSKSRGGKPMADCHCRDVERRDGGVGHLGGECQPAAHCRKHVRQRG